MKTKKIYCEILLLLCIILFTKISFSQGDIPNVSFSPRVSRVLIGNHVDLNVIMVSSNGDTSRIECDNLENWTINGSPDPNMIGTDEKATYSANYNPMHNIPAKNPLTVSCQIKRQHPGDPMILIVGEILVVDCSSAFTLDGSGLNHAAYSISTESATNGITVSNTSVFYIPEKNLSTLINTGMSNGSPVSVQISFTGKSAGYFNFGKYEDVNITVNGRTFGSFDEHGDPTSGYINVTDYGDVGKNVVVKIYGTLMTKDGNALVPVMVDGEFTAINIKGYR